MAKEEKKALKEDGEPKNTYYLTGNIGGYLPLFVHYAWKMSWFRVKVPKKSTTIAILGDQYVATTPVPS